MSRDAKIPPHYLCPISLECMRDPVIVDHMGSAYWFDRESLEQHRRSEYADNNPLTNEPGFLGAAWAPDDELRSEIHKSKCAPGPPEPNTTTPGAPSVPGMPLYLPSLAGRVHVVNNVPMPWFITIQNVMRWREGVRAAHAPPRNVTSTISGDFFNLLLSCD